jgi:hypothetical protein
MFDRYTADERASGVHELVARVASFARAPPLRHLTLDRTIRRV